MYIYEGEDGETHAVDSERVIPGFLEEGAQGEGV